MKKLLAYFVAALGIMVSSSASMGCVLAFIDEPEMPKSMIER